MEERTNYKREELKRKAKTVCKYILYTVYFSSTSVIPIYVFYYVFLLKNHLIYAATISFVSFIVMDIFCSVLEDNTHRISQYFNNYKNRKQKERDEIKKKKEEEMQKIEELLLDKDNYEAEIGEAEKEYKEFKKEIKKFQEEVSQEIFKALCDSCIKMNSIIKVLKKNPKEYYPIRHTFKVYFPEFIKTTQKYMNITTNKEISKESTADFLKLIVEFNEYLDFTISRIQSTDKMGLDVGIKALTKIIESERKRGGE